MRLFTAVRFSDDVAAILLSAAAELRSQSIRGNFTRPGNFHLTLVFLGEQPDPAVFLRALKTLEVCPFETQLGSTGHISREGGDIVFAGFQDGGELKNLYRAVCRALEPAGFACDRSDYTPHVTLGRGVETGPSADKKRMDQLLRGRIIPVNAVSLMR